eukprot:TRINITY_DN7317_c0_g1_i1.p1 TRINITY_DN7317_c0_g1~~TRINITY_DN7317_c0_g1_i1.p1  ORF type:complete len:192 (+),score=53.95 TRINITY_DN7317_c0_g1_i1:73-576(+)
MAAAALAAPLLVLRRRPGQLNSCKKKGLLWPPRAPFTPALLASPSPAPLLRASEPMRRHFCAGEDEGDSTEAFWRRRWKKVKRKRANLLIQVRAAHDQLRVFQEMGRQQLVERGRLSDEDAEKFARIDARLAELQVKPAKLEFYETKKLFSEEWLDKRFALKKGQQV